MRKTRHYKTNTRPRQASISEKGNRTGFVDSNTLPSGWTTVQRKKTKKGLEATQRIPQMGFMFAHLPINPICKIYLSDMPEKADSEQ